MLRADPGRDRCRCLTLRFPGVSVRACAAYIVRATGNKGSAAYVRHQPACSGD